MPEASETPETPRQLTPRIRIAWIALVIAALCAVLWLCWGIYSYWNDARLINFLAAWIPFVLSLLLAFIPESKMTTFKKRLWRFSVIAVGLIWSVVLWRQQIIMDIGAQQQQEHLVRAVTQDSNRHADQQIAGVRSDLEVSSQRSEKQIGSMRQSVDEAMKQFAGLITKTKDDLNTSISKVGKPEPPIPAELEFSLWTETGPFPLYTSSVRRDADGAFSVDWAIRNKSETAAHMVDLWLDLCDKCSFAKEPQGFERPAGMRDQTRHMMISLLNPSASLPKQTVDVKFEDPSPFFQIQVRYSCADCKSSEPQKATLLISQN